MSETHSHGETPTVLVVEDDQELADTYEIWLEPTYDVRTTHSGSGGLTWYDSDVDVALVDRRLPDQSGTGVIHDMERRDVDDQKAMLTSIEPGRELVDMPCDEYLTKPITRELLRETVHELQLRSALDDELQRHFRLSSKIAALEDSEETETGGELAALKREADQTRTLIEGRLAEIEEAEAAFQAIE